MCFISKVLLMRSYLCSDLSSKLTSVILLQCKISQLTSKLYSRTLNETWLCIWNTNSFSASRYGASIYIYLLLLLVCRIVLLKYKLFLKLLLCGCTLFLERLSAIIERISEDSRYGRLHPNFSVEVQYVYQYHCYCM